MMRGKEEKKEKERGEREKKRRKELGIKKNHKSYLFPLHSRHFFNQSEIRCLE